MRAKMLRGGIALLLAVPLVWLVVATGANDGARVAAAEPGGAPPPGSGTVETAGFVRVLDGYHMDATINGTRVLVRLTGVTTPQGNTTCGRESAQLLGMLSRGGLVLEEDPTVAFDDLKYRVYHARTKDGRSVSQELVRAGLAAVEPTVGDPRFQYAGDEAAARAAGRGCLWSGNAAALTPSRPAPSGKPPARTAAAAATTLPMGFTQEVVAAGLDTPVGIAFTPDGRIFVAEKAGGVRVVKNGAVLPQQVIGLYDRVNDYSDHGLLGIAVDPDFASNGYLYLLFTYENNIGDYNGKKTARLARYTVVGDTASVATEAVLLGSKVGPGCAAFYAADPHADCLVSDNPSHSIGTVRFAADKTLFVSVGDGASFDTVDNDALRVQDTRKLAGKLLRIDRAGKGLPANPFWDGNADHGQSKVWALGLRNPFRFALKPGTDTPFIGDVGWVTWEEINVGVRGANYGWPCYEGEYRQDGYASYAVCQSLYAQGPGAVRTGIRTWNHNQWPFNPTSASIGGTFYTGTTFPQQYRGAYFFSDYAQSTISWLTVGPDNIVTSGPTQFATDADGPVAFEMGPDGNMYYVAINAMEVRRLRYGGALVAQARCVPIRNTTPSAVGGAVPLTVECDSAGTTDPSGGTLTYRWDFEDGTPIVTGAIVRHTYSQAGDYTVKLTATSTSGNSGTAETYVKAGTLPPTVTITAPNASLTYRVGDVITYTGSATDARDGTLPPDKLWWQVIVHHCVPAANGTSGCHTHYLTNSTGTTGSFTVPDHDGDDTYIEIQLTSENSAYIQGTASVKLQPVKVPLTITTNPPGFQFIYSGTTYTAPKTFPVVPGAQRTVEVVPAQNNHTFSNWSDGGAAQHTLTMGNSATTLTANFTPIGPVARASVNTTSGNVPLSVAFSSAGSTGMGLQYQWDFGDGTNSTQPNPMHTYTTPGTYRATLTVKDSQNRTATAMAMPVMVRPTISAVSPNIGNPSGGERIRINGTGFANGATVSFGGVAARVTNVNGTTITVIAPDHASGVVDVVVTVNGQSATLTRGYTYRAVNVVPPRRADSTAEGNPNPLVPPRQAPSDFNPAPPPRPVPEGTPEPAPLPLPPMR